MGDFRELLFGTAWCCGDGNAGWGYGKTCSNCGAKLAAGHLTTVQLLRIVRNAATKAGIKANVVRIGFGTATPAMRLNVPLSFVETLAYSATRILCSRNYFAIVGQ